MGNEHIPPGFELHTRRSGLTDPWQPIYARRTDREVILGFRGAAAHANSRGFIHGGLISSLTDNAMGLSCGQQLPGAAQSRQIEDRYISGLVTVSLTIDFVSSAKIGQWIEIRPQVLKAGKSLCFARALILADESVCARASGIFMSVGR